MYLRIRICVYFANTTGVEETIAYMFSTLFTLPCTQKKIGKKCIIILRNCLETTDKDNFKQSTEKSSIFKSASAK